MYLLPKPKSFQKLLKDYEIYCLIKNETNQLILRLQLVTETLFQYFKAEAPITKMLCPF